MIALDTLPLERSCGKPTTLPTYLSPSGIKSYLTCPAKYYYEKVLRLAVSPSPALFLGKMVHSALAAFHRSQMRKDPMDSEQVRSHYRSEFLSSEADDPPGFKDETGRNKVFETGERMLDAYMESDLSRDKRQSLGVEIHLEEEITPGAPPLLGILDIVKKDRGEVVVADIKTCASTPDLQNEEWLNEIQLVSYALLLQRATGWRVTSTELWYLVKTKAPKVIRHKLSPLNRNQFDRFHALYDRVVEGIASGDFSPRPSFSCRFCEFRNRCEQWKGGLPS